MAMRAMLAGTISLAASVGDRPQYILFARPPGSSWSQNNPDSVSVSFLEEVTSALGTSSPDQSLIIGNEMIFSLFQTPLPILLKTLNATLHAAQESRVPVSIKLDGQNWWKESGLWNWWDPAQPGYDPANVENVEWTRANDPSSAVKIGWRNWGSQIRVAPEQNVLSSVVQRALDPRLRGAAALIAQWLHSLPESDRHLLATVKVGWEAGLQYNAYFYEGGNDLAEADPADDPTTGLHWENGGLGAGVPILGYAAAAAAALTLQPGQELTGKDAAMLTRTYVERLTAVVIAAGVPAELVTNHVGGQVPPYRAVPFSAGFASSGTPGFSFYWGPPWRAGVAKSPLLAEMMNENRTRWAAAEWNLRAKDKAGWLANFNDTLSFLHCDHIAVYNWDNDFEKDFNGHDAVKDLLAMRGAEVFT